MKLTTDIELIKEYYKSNTYKLFDEKIQGFLDGIESLKQSIYKLFKTPYGKYLIYDDYGIDIESLIGEERAYVRAELKRMIIEALKEDERILDISDFQFKFDADELRVEFKVSSIYGDVFIGEEFLIGA